MQRYRLVVVAWVNQLDGLCPPRYAGGKLSKVTLFSTLAHAATTQSFEHQYIVRPRTNSTLQHTLIITRSHAADCEQNGNKVDFFVRPAFANFLDTLPRV